MDRLKLEQLVTENMKSIFGFALTRLENVAEAEDLAGDILYEILRSSQNLKEEDRFHGFMWKIAEHTYVDYLRKSPQMQVVPQSLTRLSSKALPMNPNLLWRRLSKKRK